jgi:alginate O-acetyltransferase complex protein AlgI
MSFTSYTYLAFLSFLWLLYWKLPIRRKGQNILLLVASYTFYGFIHPWFCLLLLTVTLGSYWIGIAILRSKAHRKKWLVSGITLNLFLLGFYKYFDFFIENVNTILEKTGISTEFSLLHILLPLGISFYVFQGIGYMVDCYREKIKEKPPLLEFFLFIGFFPQLLAGPIARFEQLFPQFEKEREFLSKQQKEGFLLILWGVYKKLVIADNVGLFVNQIFALHHPSTLLILIGVLGFTIQVLADFSAYTDIARGSAKLLGIDLVENFKHPYLAKNPQDFWKRWHISLSEWIRDYIYIPLGGNRVPVPQYIFNVVFTFVLCGLWHGAAWTFLFWGLYHGFLILGHRAFQVVMKKSEKLITFWNSTPGQMISVIVMFFATYCGWLLFRVETLADIPRYFSAQSWALNPEQLTGSLIVLGMMLFYAFPLIGALALQQLPKRYEKMKNLITIPLIIMGILLLSAPDSTAFLYFQF